MEKTTSLGHIVAFLTILIWGTTFISTKFLLDDFSPIEILFIRFILGFIALSIASPRRLELKDRRHEFYFAGAGLCGVTLYFLFENIALTYTLASNVGILVSVAPFFIALFSRMAFPGEKLKKQFFLGFCLAIAGIFLISFKGPETLKINPLGDMLSILAAVVWAIYSILMKKISSLEYNTVQSTRRVFFYGLMLMIPAIYAMDFSLNASAIKDAFNLANLMYLGVGASAVCFASWNWSVKILGVMKTGVYVYAIPVVTVFFSSILLDEKLTPKMLMGIVLIILGLVVSESEFKLKAGQAGAQKN